MTWTEDVAMLDDDVRSAAIVLDNGEVMWPYAMVRDAVNALAEAEHIVLGIDARGERNEGRVTEVAISSYDPVGNDQDVDRARRAALAAVERVERITGWRQPDVLVTWK